MESVTGSASFAYSGSPQVPGCGIAGGGLWEKYKEAVAGESDELGDKSATDMNSAIIFAGLFTVTLAAFSIQTSRSLLPDASVELLSQIVEAVNTNATRVGKPYAIPFQASHAAVIVNTLWFLGLVFSLACAFLATLVQMWTKALLRCRRPLTSNVERQCLDHMSMHMSALRYGLNRIPSLVIGLMHASIIIFLVGLDVYLYSIHSVPALVIAIATSMVALGYVVASCIPLFDETCPYQTPLTDVFSAAITILIGVIPGLICYTFLLLTAAQYKVIRGTLSPALRRCLNPALVFSLLCDPYVASRSWHALKEYNVRRKSDEPIVLLPHLIGAMFGPWDLEESTEMNPGQILFLWERIGDYALDHPVALQHFAGALVRAQSPEVDALFVGFRYDKARMAKVATALKSVDSVFAATAMLRLLQLVLQADHPDDRAVRAVVGESWRWVMTENVLKEFPAFADNVGHFIKQAQQGHDSALLSALSSFRLTLVWLLSMTSARAHNDSELPDARNRILKILKEFQRFDDIKLQPLSEDDTEITEELFTAGRDPCLELASRNALTLIAGARAYGWRGPWDNPDGRYLPQHVPGTLRWHELFSDAVERRRGHKPAASNFFIRLLEAIGLGDWTRAGSDFPNPSNSELPPVAINALRDLASIVELSPLDTNQGSPGTSVVPVVVDVPGNFSTPEFRDADTENGGIGRFDLKWDGP